MDPAERARLAELNRLKKRERELEERREKIEAHRHIVLRLKKSEPSLFHSSFHTHGPISLDGWSLVVKV